TWELTFLNRMLAEYYMVKDEWNKADEYANASLQLAQKIPSKWEIFKCYEILSKVQKSKGNYKKAFEYLELHNTYKDSVIDENVVRKIKYLQLQKKENENELLKMDNASIEKQLKNSKTITYLSLIVSVLFLIALYLMFNYAKTKNSLSKKLKLSNENIAIQNESLENLNELKNRLLSTLSHDFRSPLVAIEQVLKLFKEKILDRQERDELLEKLHPQVVETIGMVNNMVYWAQNQLKSSLTTKELINLNEVLKEVIKNVKLNCELKNISIQFSEIEIPDIISDKTHLQIIFQNLLGNAIKFSNSNQKIKIFTELTKTEVRVHFKDFGSGLNQEEIDLILSSDTAMPSKLGTYNESGTGLGMLLVKQLLKKESGKLEIRSTPQKGSDFIVCLPLKSENEIE
ncbi:MAG: sensor histidine kinase, partial [Flavobacterium sp.]